MVEHNLLFAPEEPDLWREAGVLNARLGNLKAAIEALETNMRITPDGADRHRVAALLQELRRKLS